MSAVNTGSIGPAPVESPSLSYVRSLNGSAQSLLVSDGLNRWWVLKLRSDLQGPNALANEWIGASLCRELSLPVPECRVFHIADDFFDEPRTWFSTPGGPGRPQAGLHFASRFLPDATGKDVLEFVVPALHYSIGNLSACLGMLLFDVWAMHADVRQALFTVHGRRLLPTFIDNGHLFGGPGTGGNPWQCGEEYSPPALPVRTLQRVAAQWHQQSNDSDRWIRHMQLTLPAALDRAIDSTPVTWFSGDWSPLRTVLLARLQILSSLADRAFASLHSRPEEHLGLARPASAAHVRVLSNGGTEQWL